MNSTKIASRLMFMSGQLRGEAQRQPAGSDVRNDLERGARQLSYAFHSAYSKDPDQRATAEALVEGAVDYLVAVVAVRTERMLEQRSKS